MKVWEVCLIVGAWAGLAVLADGTLAVCLMVDQADWFNLVNLP